MSNANAIARTMKDEYGYDVYNGETYIKYKTAKLIVRGKIVTFKPKGGKQ